MPRGREHGGEWLPSGRSLEVACFLCLTGDILPCVWRGCKNQGLSCVPKRGWTACGLGMERTFVFLWLPAAPLLFLAIVLALKEEWFPSNTTDILQIINNGTFQPSSRYFRRAFLSRNPKYFSRLSSGSWDEEEAHECVFLEAGTGPDPCFLPFGLLWPGLEVYLCTRGLSLLPHPVHSVPSPL